MPILTDARTGRIVLAALTGLAATAAFAHEPQIVVSQQSPDTRNVTVATADLDLSTARGRNLLEIRLDNAAQRVCDVHSGSSIDKLPYARACLAKARAGALAQLGDSGKAAALSGGGQ